LFICCLGTAYDLTKGLASGPYGNPNRYDRGEASGVSMNLLMQGTFERPISLFRTAYSFVTTSRNWLPDWIGGCVWFAPAAPHASFYTPLYPSTNTLPVSYTTGHLYQYSRESIWWTVTCVQNWMERMYMYMIQDVKLAQADVETTLRTQQDELESSLLKMNDQKANEQTIQLLTRYQNHLAEDFAKSWWKLFEHLITKYHDGYRVKKK
jgi:dipeptidase